MKCFIVIACLAVASNALPQYYIADTAEVQQAKAQFAAAWNAAAARNAVPVAPVQAFAPVAQFAPAVSAPSFNSFEDGETYPEAEPYVHEEIPAEPYVHIEDDYIEEPIQVAAPVNNIVYSNNIGLANPGGCYNYKGEGVPCRTVF